jgi:hypothetical protein
MSSSTLRDWCRLCEVSPGRSLDLARFLRAVCLTRQSPWDAAGHFDVSDPRTLRNLLAQAGLPAKAPSVSVAELMANQSFIHHRGCLEILRATLSDRDSSRFSPP